MIIWAPNYLNNYKNDIAIDVRSIIAEPHPGISAADPQRSKEIVYVRW